MPAKGQKKDGTGLPTVAQRLSVIGINSICDDIVAGLSFRAIAEKHKVNLTGLLVWLERPENVELSARAREASAEAWLDKGLDTIESALDKEGGVDPSAARAYAQECARRAAIRNAQYRDSNKTQLVGANDGAVQVLNVNVSMTKEQIAEEAKKRGLPLALFGE